MYGVIKSEFISTHAPAGGATGDVDAAGGYADRFLLTPLREGRPEPVRRVKSSGDFYSRPCGRGDFFRAATESQCLSYFYSRPCGRGDEHHLEALRLLIISTHAPAGGATRAASAILSWSSPFLLTPLREGRPECTALSRSRIYFYSRPCGRGDYLRCA